MTAPAAPDYSNCWANPLGDCADGMTGEHHISRSQFGDGGVTVQGFPWCRDESITIGVDRLVANVLCGHHNSTSSPLDGAAAAVMRTLRMLAERADRLRAGGRREPHRLVRIPGDLFERWLLKTTINLALQQRPGPTGGIFDAAGRPGRRFVEIVFGRTLFEQAEGLSLVAQVGEQLQNAQHGTIRFEPWIRRDDGALVAAFMSFHGYRLWLSTVGAPAIEHALHPPRTMRADDVNVRVEFEYSRERNLIFRGAAAATLRPHRR